MDLDLRRSKRSIERQKPSPPEDLCTNRFVKKSARGANPEVMTNDYWVWLIKTGYVPYDIGKCQSSEEEYYKKWWTFVRLGNTVTKLEDGTKIHIAGEYEDSYDPDFYIYNDVVVEKPDGQIIIYGYDEDIFPPTYFHASVLVGKKVYIVGGFSKKIKDKTQVVVLDTTTFSMQLLQTTGEDPGQIREHEISYNPEGNYIRLTGGYIYFDKYFSSNNYNFELDINTLTWKRGAKSIANIEMAKRYTPAKRAFSAIDDNNADSTGETSHRQKKVALDDDFVALTRLSITPNDWIRPHMMVYIHKDPVHDGKEGEVINISEGNASIKIEGDELVVVKVECLMPATPQRGKAVVIKGDYCGLFAELVSMEDTENVVVVRFDNGCHRVLKWSYVTNYTK